ncbi:Hypothetical protein R9X50_00271100 [Acrodontium crateriforme]|uniref:Xaa-Pro aminopeptidase n=1 Tax=Acrodontium crateriforme TaxID=150365 RepID=A0AAQ3M1E6_9PEZI|nr:Hypothetical protein R9X50_00271100 [Acrodontium crateriforme]
MTHEKRIANPALPPPPQGKYPAKAHARRVAKYIAEHGGPSEGLIYLEGRETEIVEDDDKERHYRQRRHFYYLTGCNEADCFFAYDIAADKSTLWIPPVDPETVMWAGMPLLPKEALEQFDVDQVLTTDELKSGKSLSQMLGKSNSTILAIKDRADLSVFKSDALKTFNIAFNFEITREAIEECRVVKDEHEIAMIRHANIVSSYAHSQILGAVKRAKNERELNAVFVMHCHANGCKEQAYGCICASGSGAASLHYVHNDKDFGDKLNLLLDAGCEYNNYCSDITRSFPLNGKFTKESRDIYELVQNMQSEAGSMIKAGVHWEDVHMRAHAVAAKGLRQLGILNPSLSVEQILDSKITCRFMPHGLGHYLGMDTHDTGGHANYADPNEFFTYLRIRGPIKLHSVLTNEPGIYFREFPFKQELKDGKWDGIVDQEKLAQYWSVGGIRLEDDLVVLENGFENLTTVRSEVDYVESMVQTEGAVLNGHS